MYKRERVYKWTWSTQEALLPAFLLGMSSHTHREQCCGKSWGWGRLSVWSEKKAEAEFCLCCGQGYIIFYIFPHKLTPRTEVKNNSQHRGWSLDVPGISTGILRSLWASWAWAYQAARRKSHFSWIIEEPPGTQPWPILRDLIGSWWAGIRTGTNETRWGPER